MTIHIPTIARRLGVSALAALAAVGTLAAAVPTAAAEPAPVAIADRQATAATRALFAKLRDGDADSLRFGHQHALDEHVGDDADGDVHALTGQLPGVIGWDAALVLTGDEKPGSGTDTHANARRLADAIVDADARGAIVTLSAHWRNPATGGHYNDTTAVAGDLLPGGAHAATFNAMLDGIAEAAQSATRADGTAVPIVFRPLHENNGSWFWWGATHASTAEYKELFRYIVDYLRDAKGVHNLLYAYSPNGSFNGDPTNYLATYPGDAWVDLLGYDQYMSGGTIDDFVTGVTRDMTMVADLAHARGKAVALTEFGRMNDAKITQTRDEHPELFSRLADSLRRQVPSCAYMLTWANFGGDGDSFQTYTPWPGSAGADAFTRFAQDNPGMFANAANVDFTQAPAAAARDGSVRVVTPTAGSRIESGTSDIYVRTEDVDPASLADGARVVATAGGTSKDVPLSAGTDGYLVGHLDLAAAGLTGTGTLTLMPDLKYADGTPVTFADSDGTVSVKLGAKAQEAADTVDSFDTYDSDEDLQATYSPANATRANLTLADSPDGSGKAARLRYDFAAFPEYNGFQRSFQPARDWSGHDGMSLFLKPDGSDHKLVVQVNAGGVTFEAYPSTAGTEGGTVTLPFDEATWHVASWDTTHAGTPISPDLLASVGSFALYVNDNGGERPRSGDLVLDSIRLTTKQEEPAPEDPAKPKPGDTKTPGAIPGTPKPGDAKTPDAPTTPKSGDTAKPTPKPSATDTKRPKAMRKGIADTGSPVTIAVFGAVLLAAVACVLMLIRKRHG